MQNILLWIHKFSLDTNFRGFHGYWIATNLNVQRIGIFQLACIDFGKSMKLNIHESVSFPPSTKIGIK